MSEVAGVILILSVILVLVIDVAVGKIAGMKGRGVVAWFFAALFFTPVIALLMLIAAGDAEGKQPSTVEQRPARRPVEPRKSLY